MILDGNGRTYQAHKTPIETLDPDFPIPESGKATPFGIYSVFENKGFVGVGLSADTASFGLFSFISKNCQGSPLVSAAVLVEPIFATATDKGLTVKCVLDERVYEKGCKVSDEDYENLNINDFFQLLATSAQAMTLRSCFKKMGTRNA
ncbi:MAG: hypothetical protein LBS49_05880 [Candidatus Accumulibacter sp.]|jgi:hypothetical protein|nr:hypothetical protein [Accumulibacter sp.]